MIADISETIKDREFGFQI